MRIYEKMADWTQTTVLITFRSEAQKNKFKALVAPREERECFLREPDLEVFCLKAILPIPTIINGITEESDPTKYRNLVDDWVLENWGCSRNTQDSHIIGESHTFIAYRFQTAYGTPDKIKEYFIKDWAGRGYFETLHWEADMPYSYWETGILSVETHSVSRHYGTLFNEISDYEE